MKKTFAKNILRSVKGTFSRFLAIFLITALGVGFLAGLLSTEPDMRDSIDRYYDENDMMDFFLKSTWGFDEDDIEAVRQTEGVKTVMPHYLTDVLAQIAEGGDTGDSLTARIYGLPLDGGCSEDLPLNKMPLTEGRYPASSNEILAEQGNGMFESLDIGTTIRLIPGEGEELSDTFCETELTVVGIVTNPAYMSVERETSDKGNGRVGVLLYGMEELFTLDVYTDLFVTADGAKELDTYSADYEALIERAADSLEAAGKERSKLRFEKTRNEALDEIAEAEAEYLEKKADAEAELADAAKKIVDAEAEIADGRREIADGEAQLADSRKALDAQFAQLENSAAMLPPAVYAASKAQLDAALDELDKAKERIAEAKAELDEGEAKLIDSRAEYQEAKAEAEAEFADAEAEIADAKADVEALEAPEWYVLDRNANVSFVSFDSNAEKIAAIARIFPLFFFLVAALVSLTTMTRMIEEERTQIGILKALGYSRAGIMSKYILYAGVSGLLGSATGLAIGLVLFPSVIWNAYKIMYTFPPLRLSFIPEIALLSAAAAIVCTLGATVWAGAHILSEKPAALLLPRAPKAGKRVLLERITPLWKRLGFHQKVTLRNLFRYKKRFFMTVIGIAGCTALLVTGFGLRDSISDIVDLQFNELMQYNLTLQLEDGIEDPAPIEAFLSDPEQVKDSLAVHSEYGTVRAGDKELEANITVPADYDKFPDFIRLRKRIGHEAVPFGADSVVFSEKMATILGVSVGDTVELENADGETARFTVSGITENYVESYVYMTACVYEEAYEQPLSYTTRFVKSLAASPDEEDAAAEALLKLDGVRSVSFSTSMSSSFENMLEKIDYIVIVLIVCAGLLAFVVLYNLTNINIAEREKELATIKVLGFYDGEVAAYIYRETALLSLLGTAAGLVLGIFLHRFVVLTAEVDIVMFGRFIYAPSYLLSALITLIFSALVCLSMSGRLKRIDMVESMKAGE